MNRPPSPRPADLLTAALARDPGRPLITFYDDATGERIELSGSSLANWVAKTANLLVDGLGCQPGETIGIELPLHWLTGVWTMAAWSAGLRVVAGSTPTSEGVSIDVAVVGSRSAGEVSDTTGAAGEVVVVSLLPLGAPLPPGALPHGVIDFAREVPAYGDHFRPAGDPHARIDDGDPVAQARALAASWQLDEGGRLLVADELDPHAQLLATALVPLSVGGSAVLCLNPDATRMADRTQTERITASAVPR
jgi:uncharacterized protein (TIGR03089 family)